MGNVDRWITQTKLQKLLWIAQETICGLTRKSYFICSVSRCSNFLKWAPLLPSDILTSKSIDTHMEDKPPRKRRSTLNPWLLRNATTPSYEAVETTPLTCTPYICTICPHLHHYIYTTNYLIALLIKIPPCILSRLSPTTLSHAHASTHHYSQKLIRNIFSRVWLLPFDSTTPA